MTLERWDMSPSAMPDRYVLKVRGDRADVDKIAQSFARVCQEVRELSDPVYQWAVVIIGATLSERLAIQDQLREMVRPATPTAPKPPQTTDLSGVLAELSMVLGDLTGLTEEEQAFVAKKHEERQERKARTIPPILPTPPKTPPPSPKPAAPNIEFGFGSLYPPTPSATPPAPPTTSFPDIKPKTVEPAKEIVRDVPRPPSTPPPPRPAPEKMPAAAAPTPPVPAPVAPPSIPVTPLPPRSATASSASAPSDQVIRAACFYAPGAEKSKDTFFAKLTDVAQKKSKKPFVVQAVLEQATPISSKQGVEWANMAKAGGAEVVFILLPPEIGPEFMEQTVVQLELAGLHGYLIIPTEIESRLLYVDLTVELMLIKRHK